MPLYCVNTQPQNNGDHEVHRIDTCPTLPHPSNRQSLGSHDNCYTAVAQAKLTYPSADGCAHCCPACHKR